MVGKPRNQVQQLNVWGAGSPGVLGEGCGQCSSCPGATWLLCSGGHLRPGGSEVGPGVGDDSLAPGPHAPHPVRVQEPGLGSDHSGSPEGPGLCSQPGSVCCARLAGPCGQRRGAEPRTTHALSWGLLQVRPRWQCYRDCWGSSPLCSSCCEELVPLDGSASPKVLGLGAKFTAAAPPHGAACPGLGDSLPRDLAQAFLDVNGGRRHAIPTGGSGAPPAAPILSIILLPWPLADGENALIQSA